MYYDGRHSKSPQNSSLSVVYRLLEGGSGDRRRRRSLGMSDATKSEGRTVTTELQCSFRVTIVKRE